MLSYYSYVYYSYDEMDTSYTVRCWDVPLVLNIIGVSKRYHDFNIYLTFSINNDDNVSLSCCYTCLF